MTPGILKEVKCLPCPFCGGTDLIVSPDFSEDDPLHVYAYHVFCRDCHTHGRNNYPIGWCESSKQAMEAWNDRFIPATIPGEDDRVQVESAVIDHIHNELKKISAIKDRIDDLLTPVQMFPERNKK